MTTTRLTICALLATTSLAATAALAASGSHDSSEGGRSEPAVEAVSADNAAPVVPLDPSGPVALARSVQALQDRVAMGDKDAHLAQRRVLAEVSAAMLQMDDAVWLQSKNLRAAVTVVLSGGDPRLLRKIIAHKEPQGIDGALVKGALAHVEGRRRDAVDALKDIDVRELDASIAGHIALTQSMLVEKDEIAKSLALLDLARLLSPGTLVEEAALRRGAVTASAAGKFDKFETLCSEYLRRFPRSVYAQSFRRQLAKALLNETYGNDPTRRKNIETVLAEMPREDSKEVYLAIAEEGISSGAVELTRFAVRSVTPGLAPDSPERERARLYDSAALVATEEMSQGVENLNSIDKQKLTDPEVELVDAALAVAEEVKREPPPFDDEAEPPALSKAGLKRDRNGVAATQPSAERAQQLIDRVDQLLLGPLAK